MGGCRSDRWSPGGESRGGELAESRRGRRRSGGSPGGGGTRSGGRKVNDEDRGNQARVGVDDRLEWGYRERRTACMCTRCNHRVTRRRGKSDWPRGGAGRDAFDEVHSRWGIPRRRFMTRNLHPAASAPMQAAGEKVQRMRRHWTPARVERLMIAFPFLSPLFYSSTAPLLAVSFRFSRSTTPRVLCLSCSFPTVGPFVTFPLSLGFLSLSVTLSFLSLSVRSSDVPSASDGVWDSCVCRMNTAITVHCSLGVF